MSDRTQYAGEPIQGRVVRDSSPAPDKLVIDEPGARGRISAEWPQLGGNWIGHYKGHSDEVIRIEQDGPLLKAIKIIGDENVPAGEITWRADLRTLEGEGQVAERNFRNAQFVPGRLIVESPDRIQFVWCQFGSVTYRREGSAEPSPHKRSSMWSELLKRMFSD